MSSAEETQKASQLIERLLVDAPFRAAFRKDPVGACRDFGLHDLAAELAQGGGGKAMHTLEVRESKSSLAGVVMAVAAEGIGVVELHGLVEHGLLKGGMRAAGEQALRGVNPMHPASSLHSGLRAENPLHGAAGNPLGAAERGSMLAHEAGQSGGAPGSSSPAAASAGAPGGSVSPAGASPGAAAASAPGGSAAGAPVGSSAPGASAEGASATGGAAGGAGASAAPPAPSVPGTQPAVGGAAPTWPAEPSPPPAVPAAPVVSPAAAPAVPAAPVVSPAAAPAVPAAPVVSPAAAPAVPAAPVVSPAAAPAVPAAPVVSPAAAPAVPAAPVVSPAAVAPAVPAAPVVSPAAAPAVPFATPSSAAEALAGPQERAGGAATALAWAHSMLHGLPESEGANVGPALNRFEAAFGFHGAPWCGIFVGHALERAGLKVPDSIASVASILDMAQNGEGPFEKGILPVSAIRPGDLVTFGGTEHVAMVVKVDGEGIHTIAGNYENNVTEHTYPPGEVTGVVRPRYSAAVPQVQALGAAPGGASSTPVVPSAAPAPGAATVPGAAPTVPGAAPTVPGAAPADVVGAGSTAPVAGSPVASVAESPGAAQLAEVPPAQPGTAVFQAVGQRTSGASPHTVKFLQAVPAPSAEPAVAAGGGGPDPVAQAPGAPAAASEVAGQSPTAGVGATPGAAAVPGEAVAGATPGVPVEAAVPGSEPAHPVVEQSASVPGQAPGVAEAAGVVDAASSGTIPYPGDNAPKAEIAQWMGDLAAKHGLPRELPVMASLVESSLHNDNFGDRDSLGYFQMRTSIWDNGQYAGYPNDPELQVKWFIDQALAVKNQMPDRHFGSNPANFGEWIDEIERPAEEYRGRYQAAARHGAGTAGVGVAPVPLTYARPAANRTRFESPTAPPPPAASLAASVMAAQVSSCTSCGCGAIIAVIGGAISLMKVVNSSGDCHSNVTSASSTSTSEKPDASSRPPSASGVGRESGPGVPGGGGGTCRRCIAVRMGIARNGTRSGDPHELIAIRPPGSRKLRIRATAASASGSKMIPQRESAASKLASGKSRDAASD